jgi:hypothetical protein
MPRFRAHTAYYFIGIIGGLRRAHLLDLIGRHIHLLHVTTISSLSGPVHNVPAAGRHREGDQQA